MEQEDKAEAYDKVRKKIAIRFGSHVADEFFAEFEGSMDEVVKEALCGLVHDTTGDELWVDYGVHKEEALAWLEKQGEKKPQENKGNIGGISANLSVEDEQHIDSLLKRLDALCRNKFERTRFAISEDRDWLKSLRPQNHWKPSDEQMNNK